MFVGSSGIKLISIRNPVTEPCAFPEDFRKHQTKWHHGKAQELTGLIKRHQNKGSKRVTC